MKRLKLRLKPNGKMEVKVKVLNQMERLKFNILIFLIFLILRLNNLFRSF